MIGDSAVMTALRRRIAETRQGTGPVLVLGETGSGKGVVARAIHAKGVFFPVNCAAEGLFESRVFGHQPGSLVAGDCSVRGALEQAAGGTVYLDGIAELSLRHQAMILDAVEGLPYQPVGAEHWVTPDGRIVAATNANLEACVHAGRFREDLFYRLAVHVVHVPPLRAHLDDVPALALHFMGLQKTARQLSAGAMDLLASFEWPGNVRQLKNNVERLAIQSDGEIITADEVARMHVEPTTPTGSVLKAGPREMLVRLEGAYEDIIDPVSSAALQQFMADARGNVSEAARRAGMDRNTLKRLLARYGLR
jgi:DNA-binding NtrC family response regulator